MSERSELTTSKGPTLPETDRARRVLTLRDVEAPFPLADSERDAYLRRVSTLFADDSRCRRGGLGRVLHATNALGEQFAVKLLILPSESDGGRDTGAEENEASLRLAFRREYECQRSLALLRGFPRLYAYGHVDGVPAIVMEWVEGLTLVEARHELAVDDEGRLSPLTVARMGRDLFELIARLSLVGGGLVHRDVSMANVMVRTAHRSLEQQRAEGSFDLCLIDFGSAEPAATERESFTVAHGALRHATVAYAPPEMLSDDVAEVERQRHSSAIDVYAAGSVLCELLGGQAPFPDATRVASPYRHKVERAPDRPVPAHAAASDLAAVLAREGEAAVIVAPLALERELSPNSAELRRALSLADEQIADALMACLAVDQRRRPMPELMRDELDGLAERYGRNVRRTLDGRSLTPCMTGSTWLGISPPLSRWRLLRTAGRAIGLLSMGAVVATTSWLAGAGDPGRTSLVATLLLAPSLLALVARWRDVSGAAGLVGGSVALAAGSVASAALFWAHMGMGDSLPGALAAVLACASATWLPLAVDYACACAPSIAREAKRQLPAPVVESATPTLEETKTRHLP